MTTGDAALTQLRRGALEHCVLALLQSGERYGYDLVTELSEAGLLASEGTLYPLLSRLRRDELVSTSWQESPSGPPRRYYALTDAGRASLDTFRHAWTQFAGSVDQLLQKGTP
ncbi:PadR family transcriptional regulator PadR [Nocardioides sp. BE266]|uniref:PadR family transcriptional regulator n=1 Tax=Nocardioides sp. BE266 TaxID=2817725 RepID=UPI002865D1CF|nr:PadR family transcriptional regulator [Nocardioides sp. BE266]MDR7255830.1 PadR family transcriptional regulator PadR [Nocardioides sp. BE266]